MVGIKYRSPALMYLSLERLTALKFSHSSLLNSRGSTARTLRSSAAARSSFSIIFLVAEDLVVLLDLCYQMTNRQHGHLSLTSIFDGIKRLTRACAALDRISLGLAGPGGARATHTLLSGSQKDIRASRLCILIILTNVSCICILRTPNN